MRLGRAVGQALGGGGNLLKGLIAWFKGEANAPDRAESHSEDPFEAEPVFVYIKLPGKISPDERGERFEDPISELLETHGVGEVTGGGTMLGIPNGEGQTIEFCGIDVDLFELEEGLQLLQEELLRLAAPRGTTLEFTVEGQEHVIDIYEKSH